MFEPVLPIPLMIVLASLFDGLGILLEWRRHSSSMKRLLRMAAFCGLSIGIFAIVLRPKIETELPGITVAYLTQGYIAKTLDSLYQANHKLKIYSKYDAESRHPKVASINQLAEKEGSIKTIFVLGFGLDDAERETSLPIHFIPTWPPGIVGIDFPKDITVGDSAWVTLFTHLTDTGVIFFTTPDGRIDSTTATPGYDLVTFRIKPKLAGEYLYTISCRSNSVIMEEDVAIRVHRRSKFNILILNEYPTFESRYLKTWLSNAGHYVTTRNKVSKTKYRYEYANTSPIPFRQFGSNYDLVVIDVSSLKALTRRQMSDLKLAITQGTGVLIQSDEELMDSKYFKNWFKTEPTTNDEFIFQTHGLPRQPYRLMSSRFHVPIITDKSGVDVVVQKRLEGEGAIIMSLLPQTYPLLLQGYDDAYNSYWQRIISAAVSNKSALNRWGIKKLLPAVNEPMDVNLTSEIENPSVMANDVSLPMIRNISHEDEWQGRYWPDRAGWTVFSVLQDSTHAQWEYIYPQDDWQSIKQYNKTRETMSMNIQTKKPGDSTLLRVPISMWIWYTLILFCLSFLWLEPKV